MPMRILATLLLSFVVGPLWAQDKAEKKDAAATDPLAPFKQLAGDWVGKGTHDGQQRDATVSYKVTSAGTAVVETIGPGTNHEMVSVICVDGDELALTHYCALGNQPHMKAKVKPGDSKVAFDFVSAGNLKSDKDMYMRSVTFTFVDKNTLKAEWINYNDGKPAGKAMFEMTRKK